ncbi:GNAT family N-acetyltransferase [Nonomuraea sp. NPDC050404]|uniref:GNAT family N-acetyltransferase n=1 Tax=Nonomuraea sp. NPDC050404 TaxID=3155783 RepID=UPI003408B067
MKLERLTGPQALARTDHLVEIYLDAFSGPPWHENERDAAAFAERLAADVRRPGFTAVLASDGGRPMGFGTAWPTPAPFPTGRAYDLVRAGLGDEVETRLVGALEVDELAVCRQARGRGLAGRILDLLCAGADTCWLLTLPAAADAVRLYERLGWERLTGPDAEVAVFSRRPGGASSETYVRFQSLRPNARGTHPGVFGLVNGLAMQGRLSEAEERFRRENNAWYEANFTNPATVDPSVYDRSVNPGAAAWFKSSAGHLMCRASGYLEILAAHGVECVRLESADPGRIVYEDDDQVVVVPHTATGS